MKSFIAILLTCLLLGGSLLPGLSIDQSTHWGDLVEHYQEHRLANPNLSFMDFLAMHYGANSEHQKHPKHSHQHLPASGHSIPVYTPNAVGLVSPSPFQISLVTATNFSRQVDLYSFIAVFALINPPRA